MSNKKKNKTFLRALANYSALGGALIGSLNQVQATIQYSTLTGTPVSAGTAGIPIPSGTLDIVQRSGIMVSVNAAGGASFSGTLGWQANAMDVSSTVDAAGSWRAGSRFLGYSTQGQFPSAANKYLPFRFDNGGTTNYGWVRIDVVANSSSFTLIEYAYQDDGTSILTGDKGPLPIELTSFDARKFAEGVELLWSTSREENFDGFSLERAEGDGIFTEIAWQSGTGGTDKEEYSYRDQAAIENKRYYYRLKSVDIDGSFAYSRIVEVTLGNSGFDIGDIFPNPVTDQMIRFNISARETEPVGLMLFSAVGQLVYEEKKQLETGTNAVEISIPELTPGAYFLKVQAKYQNEYKKLIVR